MSQADVTILVGLTALLSFAIGVVTQALTSKLIGRHPKRAEPSDVEHWAHIGDRHEHYQPRRAKTTDVHLRFK